MSTIYISISDDIVEVPHNITVNSKLIKGMLSDIDNNIITVSIPIPSKFKLAFNNYKYVLIGNQLPIDDANFLLECLMLSNYLDDNNYFQYLLSQLFNNWSNMSFIVYGDKISNELQYDILLHCPYDFLPQKFRDDNVFITTWLKLNQNTIVVINGNKTYHINEFDYANDLGINLVSYHNIDNIDNSQHDVGDVFNYFWYINTNNEARATSLVNLCVNGYNQGLHEMWYKTWYENGNSQSSNIKSQGYYDKGKEHGMWKQWYKNGNIKSRGNYDKGERQGVWEEWHNNGNIKSIGSYELDGLENINYSKKYGLWEEWNSDGCLKNTCWYDRGKKHGVYNYYYDDGQLGNTGLYNYDKKSGLWQAWYRDGTLMHNWHYDNDKEHGLWEAWGKNGKIKSKGYYNNDRKLGVWETFDENGNLVETVKH